MKISKKGIIAFIAGGLLFTSTISTSFAATPVTAGLSPANETKSGTSTATFTKKLSWGGGTTNKYVVTYYDGIANGFIDSAANYYSTNYSKSYSNGSLSTKTWNTNLRVSNGTTDTAYGSVTLSDR